MLLLIHRDLVQLSHNDSDRYQDTPVSSCCLEYFDEVTISDLLPIVRPLAKKSCDLDPVPACLMTASLDVLMPVITKIVNLSLESGFVPTKLKEAILKPYHY